MWANRRHVAWCAWCGSCALLLGVALGCGGPSPASPFVEPDSGAGATDAATDRDARDVGVPVTDAAPDADPALGGPCLDDVQCDDGIACTTDRCDKDLERCRNVPDDGACQDSVFCDGLEVCDRKLGCLEGEPVTCNDDYVCTIDTCVEATQGCTHALRDADGDGDPVWNCGDGTDCNDTNPQVSGLAPEICDNDVDDDCDGSVDEADGCVSSDYDTCVEPLLVTAAGRYLVSTAGARPDYAATCAGSGGSWRDVVVALTVPEGPPLDVDITGVASGVSFALAAAGKCGDASSELGCEGAVPAASGGGVARLLLRGLKPGNYPLYVFATTNLTIALEIDFVPATPAPTNETCGTALPLAPSVHSVVPLIDAARDLESKCIRQTGELVYYFDLSEARDVHVHAASVDGRGHPSLSLRRANCSAAEDELFCQSAAAAHVFGRALGPGRFYVALSATAPTAVDLVLELAPPTVPPKDENCQTELALTPNRTVDVPLVDHLDDLQVGCLLGARDAAYTLAIGARSDVLLVERITRGDTGGLSLARTPCASASDLLACSTSSTSPVRTLIHDVAPGSYRVIGETTVGGAIQLSAFVRPAATPVFVALADECADAVHIPESGGVFQGNTANASAGSSAGCDGTVDTPAGAPEQFLVLDLSAPRRVIFDMQGSEYQTLLDVRRGPSCPGQEIALACAAGYSSDRSYLDLSLAAGRYYVQIDGYSGASGAWRLDVFVMAP